MSLLQFEVRRVRKGWRSLLRFGALEWTWALVSRDNGQFICGPQESFKQEASCLTNLASVRSTDAATPVVYVPYDPT